MHHTVPLSDISIFIKLIQDTYISKKPDADIPQACIFVLTGDLGAGKTTFSQHLLASLGVQDHVQSPTFVIAREYALSESVYGKVIHMDAYRIESTSELPPLGFDTWIHDPKNIILIEWGDLIRDALKEVSYMELVFSVIDETTRDVEVKEIGSMLY